MRCAGDLFKERLMQRQKGACLICGEPLVYLKQAEMMKCSFCGKEEPSYAKCGAAVSAGMCMSIITGTTPLSGKTWGLANITTALALEAIGRIGGPRCCKRDSFTAVIEAAKVIKAELGTALDMPPRVTCAFSAENKQCLGKNCPYFQGKTE